MGRSKLVSRWFLYASFLILLISFSSFSNAQVIDAYAYGKDSINGMTRGSGDSTTFIASILSQSTVEKDEVIISFDTLGTKIGFSDSSFCKTSSCSLKPKDPAYTGNIYECKCESQWSYSDKIQLSIIYDEGKDSKIDGSISLVITPDFLPPTIDFAISQEGAKIFLDYEIKDRSCEGCEGCSGISTIYLQDQEKQIKEFKISTTQCFVEGREEISYTKEGEKVFTLIAKDMLWKKAEDDNKHMSSSTYTYEIDLTSPMISGLSVKKGGKDIEFISDSIAGAEISFKVKEKNPGPLFVKESVVEGKEIDLAPNACVLDEATADVYTCTISGYNILSPLVSFSIRADDLMGNSKTTVLSKELKLDDVKPVLQKIETQGGIFLNPRSNEIILTIKEDGAGLNEGNIFLDLGSIGSSSQAKADSCVKASGVWKCYFEDIKASRSGSIYVLGISTDDVGNLFEGEVQASLILDDDDPKIDDIRIYAIGEDGEREYFQSGDTLYIEAIVDSLGSSPILSIEANLTGLYEAKRYEEKECIQDSGSNLYRCKIEAKAIKAGFYVADIPIFISDLAGNNVNLQKKVSVYGLSGERPNNFNLVVDEKNMIPKKINRLTASIMPNDPGYRMMIPFTITGGGNDVVVLRYRVDSCTIDGSSSAFSQNFATTDFPLTTLLHSTDTGEENFFELTFTNNVPEVLNMLEDFEVNCTISIFERVGKYVYNDPEIEYAVFPVSFRDSALSEEPAGEVLKKIESKRDGIIKDTQIISDMAGVMDTLTSACTISEQIVSAWNVFASIESIGLGIKEMKGAKAEAIGESIYAIGCVPYEFLGSTIGKLYYGDAIDISGAEAKGFGIRRCGAKFDAGGVGLDRLEVDTIGDKAKEIPTTYKTAGSVVKDSSTKLSGLIGEWKGDFRKDTSGVSKIGFPGLRNICAFVGCEYSTTLSEKLDRVTLGEVLEVKDASQGANPYLLDLGSFGRISRQSAYTNPQDSILLSTATVCIPGIIYNLEKYREIECQYVKCLKDMAVTGNGIAVCEAKKDQSVCMTVYGEVTETVGFFRLMRKIGNEISTLGTELLPSTLKWVVDNQLCSKKGNEDAYPENKNLKLWIALSCDVPRAYYNTVDSWERVKSLGRYADKESWRLNYGESVCDMVMADDFLTKPSDITKDLPDDVNSAMSGGDKK